MNDSFDGPRHFDRDKAQSYDGDVPQVIPGYDLFHALAGLMLENELGPRARVLVVGAGTGMEMLTLSRRRPEWRFTAVDPSPDMLAVARRKVTGAGGADRVHWVRGVVDDLPTDVAFDAATLILVMQFVRGEDEKSALLRSVASRLEPGAPLVLVDLHGDPAAPGFAKMADGWRQWQFAAGLDASVIEDTFRHVLSDIHFVPEDRVHRLLEQAGFSTVVPFFRALLFGGWMAWKG